MKTIVMNAIKTGKATSFISRSSNRARAFQMASNQTYPVSVLLGDDGYYWIPSSGSVQGYLQSLGYEVA